jgi:glycosyltransferase involved in cell wall biosynthesis
MKYVRVKRSGPPTARNVGLGQARGEIVAFFDDDVVCREDCVERAISYFSRPAVAIVESNLRIQGTGGPLQKFSSAPGFVTAAIFFRKSVVQELGGLDGAFFDNNTGIFFRDDTDLGYRILEAGYESIHPEDVIAHHPPLFNDIKSCFAHAQRYMFDPLLYRKHPRLFRSLLERKRIGSISFSRPMHYSSLLYCISLLLALLTLSIGLPVAAGVCAAVAAIAYFLVRFKFQGRRSFYVWSLGNSLAFAVLPLWYVYWFVHGCTKFGGWKCLV